MGLSLFNRGLAGYRPFVYPIVHPFCPREHEQSCAQRYTTFNTFRRNPCAGRLHPWVSPFTEPRAPSPGTENTGDGVPRGADGGRGVPRDVR